LTTGSHPTPTDPIAPPGAVVVHVCARSDVGRTREHNEDAFLVADLAAAEPMHFEETISQRVGERGTLFMVADGMGGAAAGEIASEMAVEIVLQQMRRRWSEADETSPVRFVSAVKGATEVANATIHLFASEHPEYRGMGTTCTIAGILGDTLYLAQVGDSRAYLVRDGVAQQITKDQSLMQKLLEAGEITAEEAEQSERRNIILQALGPDPAIKIDLTHQRVRRGDVLILCSDGLTALVRPEAIGRAVAEEPSLEHVCERLISMANDAGGPDNITVIAARFEGTGLDLASEQDEVGHQVFASPEITPVQTIALEPGTPGSNGDFLATAPVSDLDRRRRGMRYVRGIAAVGVALILLFIIRFFLGL
jgi:PPM family protein phosphatase